MAKNGFNNNVFMQRFSLLLKMFIMSMKSINKAKKIISCPIE